MNDGLVTTFQEIILVLIFYKNSVSPGENVQCHVNDSKGIKGVNSRVISGEGGDNRTVNSEPHR